MALTHEQFVFYSGDHWKLELSLHDDQGAALDLTGAQVEWTLYDAATGEVVITLTVVPGEISILDPPTDGKAQVIVAPARTSTLAPGAYYDVTRAMLPSGFVSTQAVGTIMVAEVPAAADDTPTTRLEALRRARYSGALRIRFGDEEVVYRSDAELARAIATLEEEVAPRIKTVVVRTLPSKGW